MTATRTIRRPSAITMLAPLLLAGLLACDPAPAPSGPKPSTPAPSTTDQLDPRAAIETVYNDFWDKTHVLDGEPIATWRDQLARVATNPQLKTTLRAMRFQHDIGESAYGHVRARISDVQINGRRATVIDCQDASRSGLKDTHSGKKKTVGIARNPVRALLKLDPASEQWKVAKISYPGGEC